MHDNILRLSATLLMLNIICVASRTLYSQDTSADNAEHVTVRCVDAHDKPVAGAEVYLFQHIGHNNRFVQFGPYVTDSAGIADCTQEIKRQDGGHDRFMYARVPGKLVGVARSAKWKGQAPFNSENRVRLFPSQTVQGSVSVPPGFDPNQVKVRVQTLHVAFGESMFAYESFPRDNNFPGLDIAIPDIMTAQPDPQGKFAFKDVPVRGQLYLVTTADGLGEAQWRNDGQAINGPIRLDLTRESFVAGKVLAPDGTPVHGAKVTARLSVRGRIKLSHLTSFTVETDRAGEFNIKGLPQTEFTLDVNDPEKRWTFRPLENQFVEPNTNESLTLHLETAIHVRGHVYDPDGHPIAAAHFSALADSEEAPGLDHSSTDENGAYDFLLPAGKAQLYFNALPEGFAYPDPQIIKKLDVSAGQQDVEDLDFTLQRKAPTDKQ